MGKVRIEVMWCVDCGARFTQEEISGWGCPKCGSQDVPCAVEKDTTVEVNWHELHILSVWAENWAQNCVRNYTDERDKWMPITVAAIARRLQAQHPELGHLTLSGEIASLPGDLAKAGIEVGAIETHNVDKPKLLPVNGPGAVGRVSSPRDATIAWLTAEIERLNAVERLMIDDKVEADTRTFRATAKCVDLTAALKEARGVLEAMINEWKKMTRYGSPLAKQANDNLGRARAALATINAALGKQGT